MSGALQMKDVAAEPMPSVGEVIELLRQVPDAETPSEIELRILKAAAGALSARVANMSGADAAAFDKIELQIEAFSAHPPTTAGFPRVRPEHCAEIIQSLIDAANAWDYLFRSGDPLLARDFEAVVEAFSKTDVRAYPSEYQQVLILLGRVRLVRGDHAGVRKALGYLADRPYLVEAGFHPTFDIICIDLQARSALGEVSDFETRVLWYAVAMVRLDFRQAFYFGSRMACFLAVAGPDAKEAPWSFRFARFLAGKIAAGRRIHGWKWGRRNSRMRVIAFELLLAATLLWISFVVGPKAFRAGREPDVDIVTRAMGGIGDLLMMTPGLRALSQKRGAPIKFAAPKRFHAVFAGNPHVELVDIETDPLRRPDYRNWRNFTVCPAGTYEARHQPNIKRGRVEIFARAMGVKPAELDRAGWTVEYVISPENRAFCTEFLAGKGLGGRPVIGVQPYSRDSYKDHTNIAAIIQDLARDYDVVLFHHRLDGLPQGPGIADTAGLSLDKSIALVSCLKAMVSVDSAFLHACSAFDVPVVALFGPTDGRTFTKHHRRVDVIAKRDQFPCMPCWRNEDLPCHVTGSVGVSPCIASITIEEIRASLVRLEPSLAR